MKQLILQRIIPLTIISFATLTKWWYTLPVDAPHTFYSGFPLAYVGDGWGSSMTLQFFALEFIVDLLFYFCCWLFLIYCFNRFVMKLKVFKTITILLYSVAFLMIGGAAIIVFHDGNYLKLYRDYEMDVVKTGFKFTWEYIERPK